MPLPRVRVRKVNGQTGVTRPGKSGILAIIAPSQSGTLNQVATFAKKSAAASVFGTGPLAEYAAHVLDVVGKQVVLLRADAATAGSYGTPVYTGAGTSVVTPDVATVKPLDDFEVLIEFLKAGTIGVAGITYRWSLDDGETNSAEIALGTATSFTIANTGVKIALAAGTILAGQTMRVRAFGPQLDNSNLAAALEALRISRAVFEGILVAGESTPTMVSTLQTWITAREAEGRWYHGYVNARYREAGETDAEYDDDLSAAYASVATDSICVGADGGYVPSSLPSGRRYIRPVALGLAARAMASDPKVMPSKVSDGPLDGWTINDERDNPIFHDENVAPGLSDHRFTTFRSIDGETGVYINLPLLFSAEGSDYVYLPHVRCMNIACDLTAQVLRKKLSSDQRKNAQGTILEEDAQRIERSVQTPLDGQLKRPARVSDTGFNLSRDDDASSNAGVTLTGEVWIQPLIYVTDFDIEAKFLSKPVAVSAGG